MGMAAGQARLLSITARMSDNELRAQIINNNKMRLATESSQVSEAYIQALNDAQLMFSNYDANNNATYQQLTFNALTAYNPYNNQYALSNASGNVLLSELDAKNYESVRKFGNSEDRLAAFLKCYGLEYTTNYFDETLSKSGCYGNSDADGTMQSSDKVYLPLYNSDGTLELGKGNDGYYALRANTGFKVEELQKMYEGGSVNDTLKSDGYINIIQSEAYYNYQSALNDYSIKKEDYEAFVAVAKEARLDKLVEDLSITQSGTTITTMDALISYIGSIEAYTTVTTSTTTETAPKPATTSDDFCKIKDKLLPGFATDYQSLMTSTETTTWLSNLTTELTNSCGSTYTETIPAREYVYANTTNNGSGDWYIMSKDIGENGSITYTPFAKVSTDTSGNTLIVRVDGHNEVQTTTAEGTTTYLSCPTTIYTEPTSDSPSYQVSGVTTPNTSLCDFDETIPVYWGSETATSVAPTTMHICTSTSSTGETVYPNTDSEISYFIPNEQPKEQNALIVFLEELRDSIYTKWDSENFKGAENAEAAQGTDEWCQHQLYTKYTAYNDAAIKLGKVIYGDTYTGSVNGQLPIDQLGDFLNNAYYIDTNVDIDLTDDSGNKIKEKSGASFEWDSVSEGFRQVLQVLILDEVMNTYGEPKFAYIDEANPNENGDAKAQWYTNLFNRIEDGGYRTLKDGLASSPEWIKFAFESGIITLEQVDDKYTWNKMIYTNSADITEQTDSVAVAKAEAEYNAAMNKIENKDKRYDMELKNIDTEHNSLQTEYESIKTAIDKNIERTFKLYS